MNINGVEYDTLISIDPGANGAIVWHRDGLVKSADMPSDFIKLDKFLKYIQSISKRVFAAIEKQSLWIGDMSIKDFDLDNNEDSKELFKKFAEKNREQAAKVFRLQKLLENYTSIKNLFYQLKFDFISVAAVSWQSTLGLINRESDETDTQKKNRHKELAMANFKGIQITHKNADALLILYFIFYKSQYDVRWFQDKKGSKIVYTNNELI